MNADILKALSPEEQGKEESAPHLLLLQRIKSNFKETPEITISRYYIRFDKKSFNSGFALLQNADKQPQYYARQDQ